jgi:hypothetical protein
MPISGPFARTELRSAFGGHDFIRTVRGTGYQWIGEVSGVPMGGRRAAAQTRIYIAAAGAAILNLERGQVDAARTQ